VSTLSNTRIGISVDESTGALTSLKDLKFGDELLRHACAANGHAPVRIVCLDSTGNRVELAPASVTSVSSTDTHLEAEHGTCRATSGDYREVSIACTWSIEVASVAESESVWRVRLKNRTDDLVVIEVMFPVLRGIAIGDRCDDSVLVFPHHAGERIQDPVRTMTSRRYMEFWRGATVREDSGIYAREMNYCGLASMMWMDLYTENGGTARGIYAGSHDPTFILTGIRSETGGPESPWMGLAFRKHVPIRPGSVWESSPYSVALHDGDWRWGALHYRSWILHHIKMPVIPKHLAYDSALCPRYDLKNGGVVLHKYNEIPKMYDQALQEGINHLFISAWNRSGFDTDYPEYVPDMELGSSWELAEGCRSIRQRNGKCSFYINVRLFDLESDYYERLGKYWALKDYRGDIYRESYGPRSFAVLCPGNSQWRKWAVDTASWMSRAFGAQGIYLDQLGSADPFPCYDESHSHTVGGGHHHGLYNHGYMAMIREVRDRITEIDPHSFIMIENCGDIYSQYLYANLTWNGAAYDEFFDMYKYTFPEFIQINMVNPRRVDDPAERGAWFYRDMARAFVLGSVFWSELGDRFEEGDERLLGYFRSALRLRQQAAPFIARGVYRYTDGMDFVNGTGSERTPEAFWRDDGKSAASEVDWTALPFSEVTQITASRWALPRNGALILMSNPQQVEGKQIRVRPLESRQWRMGSGVLLLQRELGGARHDRDITIDGDYGAVLEVPKARLSFAALLPKVER